MFQRFRQMWYSLGRGTRLLLLVWIAGSLLALLGRSTGILDALGWLSLNGDALRRLQLWRPVTFALVAADPMTLLFGALLLGWLGTALERNWSARWFLAYYVVCAAVSGLAIVRLAGPAADGLLSNTGAILGLVVAWHALNRHQRLCLFGGPVVSATTAAALVALGLVLPMILTAGWRLALAQVAGAAAGWLALRLHTALAGRRAAAASSQPRMRRLEL